MTELEQWGILLNVTLNQPDETLEQQRERLVKLVLSDDKLDERERISKNKNKQLKLEL